MAKKGTMIEDQYSKEDLMMAIEKSQGSIKDLAAKIGCTRATVYDWLDRCPEMWAEFNRLTKIKYRITLDAGADSLLEKIESSDERISLDATKFALRYGKDSMFNPDVAETKESAALTAYLDNWHAAAQEIDATKP
jgi:transposase-like protein